MLKDTINQKLRSFHFDIPLQLGTRRLSVRMPSRPFNRIKGGKSFMFLMNFFPVIKVPRHIKILFDGSIKKKK